MTRVEYVKPNFSVNAFTGTAAYYARYRVPYPDALLNDLIEQARISGEGRLLDLACGPGRVALNVSASFREIWAIDLEPEMIEVGRNEATRRGVKNLKWFVGRAEDFEAPPASFEMITIGEAFHRLDQQMVARQTLRWLKPGGCLATLGCYGITTGQEPWQGIIADIVRRWTCQDSSSGGASAPPKPGIGPDHDEMVLREAGYGEVASHPFVKEHIWTTETIMGYLYSTSFCSKGVLGDNAGAFETDLKTALFAHDGSGRFREAMRCGYTIGRKCI
jgi:SAM-dependent methyltransferase